MAVAEESKELLQAQLELWHHAFGYVKSMTLAVALDLGIADAIYRRGGRATLSQILADAALSPCKLHGLRRLMRALTVAGTFTVATSSEDSGGEAVYELTPASRLLVSDDVDGGDGEGSAASLSPVLRLVLNPFRVSLLGMGIGAWFRREDQPGVAPFAVAHGRNMWEMAARKPTFNALVNDAMAADSRFLMRIVLRECAEVFHGIGSLIDVAGGLGGTATSIAKAFPELRCSVLDLPHVVASAPSGGNVPRMFSCPPHWISPL
ncbi:hypothetical protein PVAP13_7NG135000 [Panicum virgatum]|uniref:Uncharacterized protein n=1 Tax=Panicum virgatum TaxID=38727 RepID=A0A8T0Q5Y0_PANVG|nr:hypothetical protein PVAP13_7NG135000 [Panicum virgatum]